MDHTRRRGHTVAGPKRCHVEKITSGEEAPVPPTVRSHGFKAGPAKSRPNLAKWVFSKPVLKRELPNGPVQPDGHKGIDAHQTFLGH
jgi:hypothetical protein